MQGANVLIAIPTRGVWESDFAMSLIGLTKHTKINHEIVGRKTTNIAGNRQFLAKKAIDDGFSHILYLDDDMVFPKETLDILIEHDKDIIGVNATTRSYPTIQFTSWTMEGKRVFTNAKSKGLTKVKKTGFGVILIKTDVFKNLEMPYFVYDYDKEKEVYVGEDFYFCDRAREKDYQIYIDQGLSKSIMHIGKVPFNYELV